MNSNVIRLLKDGSISFQKALFQEYKRLGITDIQFLLILHLHVFEQEGKSFPTIQEIEERMSLSGSQIIQQVQSLLKHGWITIDQDYDEWGKLVERYNLTPLYQKLFAKMMGQASDVQNRQALVHRNLFSIFEQEMGRPLSPIEIEHINHWLDDDQLSEELIIAALKEASLMGKLSFRYIDRILFDWTRNNIKTEEEAKQFSLRFREKQYEQQRKGKKSYRESENEVRFSQFNWLENK